MPQNTSKPVIDTRQIPPAGRRYVGLVFDDVNTSPAELLQARMAARRFINNGQAAGDQVAVLTTSGAGLTPFTAEVPRLLDAIDRVNPHFLTPGSGTCPGMTPFEAYLIANDLGLNTFVVKILESRRCNAAQKKTRQATTSRGATQVKTEEDQIIDDIRAGKMEMDPVMLQAKSMWQYIKRISTNTMIAIDNVIGLLAKMPGDRMVLLASSGFMAGNLDAEMDEVINHALRAGVVINALDAKGLYVDEPIVAAMGADSLSIARTQLLGSLPKLAANDALGNLSYSTGGLFFHNSNDLYLGFRKLGLRPETSYSLGFESPVRDGKYHSLKVTLVGNKKYQVQARMGYVAAAPNLPGATAERRIDSEVSSANDRSETPCFFRAVSKRDDNGEFVIDVVLHLDIAQLQFKEAGGIRTQKITFIATLRDPSGAFVTGKEGEIVFALHPSTYQKISEQGVNASLSLPVTTGKYQLRMVMQEDVAGKMTSTSQFIEVL